MLANAQAASPAASASGARAAAGTGVMRPSPGAENRVRARITMAATGPYESAALDVLASWIAYVYQHGLNEENIFKVPVDAVVEEQAVQLKADFIRGVAYVVFSWFDEFAVYCTGSCNALFKCAVLCIFTRAFVLRQN